LTGPTYANAPESLITHWEKRRAPMGFSKGESLAGLDTDLALLQQTPLRDIPYPLPDNASRHCAKEHELRREMGGQSELVLLHAMVISHLRKRSFPAHAPALFYKIWAEHSADLLAVLDTRWLISAAITFGDYGKTVGEQMLGRELGMLFSIMKLYEFERLHAGKTPDDAFGLRRVDAKLPLGMTPFSLASGGLDINLLAPLWQRAQAEDVMGPLACTLLDRLNSDPGGIFRRINAMRSKKQARIAARNKDERKSQ
jgi:hypothetical protein